MDDIMGIESSLLDYYFGYGGKVDMQQCARDLLLNLVASGETSSDRVEYLRNRAGITVEELLNGLYD